MVKLFPKTLEKISKKLEEIGKKIGRKAMQKKHLPKVKRILRKEQASVTIPSYKSESVLGDVNRFFKNEYEETKRSLFFE